MNPADAQYDASGSGAHRLPNGTRLGEFEITGLVGEGGFSVVYLAWDHSLERKVALKEFMPSSLAARTANLEVLPRSQRQKETFDAALKSFVNEGRLLAQFDHPALVKVYRFWEANGTAYMVMPFYKGITLKERMRSKPQPPSEAWLLNLLDPLTEALLVIHQEHCFHRDIAPDNVLLLAAEEKPLLLDFGAARRVIGDKTQALTVILKPGFAPLEQYAEDLELRQGPWTDVYALAAVLHWTITGKSPPVSVGRMIKDSYVPLVSSAAGRYSRMFLESVDRALAVMPEQRTPSINRFREELGLANKPARRDDETVVWSGRDATVLEPPSANVPAAAAAATKPVHVLPSAPPDEPRAEKATRPAEASPAVEAPVELDASGADSWTDPNETVLVPGISRALRTAPADEPAETPSSAPPEEPPAAETSGPPDASPAVEMLDEPAVSAADVVWDPNATILEQRSAPVVASAAVAAEPVQVPSSTPPKEPPVPPAVEMALPPAALPAVAPVEEVGAAETPRSPVALHPDPTAENPYVYAAHPRSRKFARVVAILGGVMALAAGALWWSLQPPSLPPITTTTTATTTTPKPPEVPTTSQPPKLPTKEDSRLPAQPPPAYPSAEVALERLLAHGTQTLAVSASAETGIADLPASHLRLSYRATESGYLYVIGSQPGTNELILFYPAPTSVATRQGPVGHIDVAAPVPHRGGPRLLLLLARERRDPQAAQWNVRERNRVRTFGPANQPGDADSSLLGPARCAGIPSDRCDAGFGVTEVTQVTNVITAPQASPEPSRPASAKSDVRPKGARTDSDSMREKAAASEGKAPAQRSAPNANECAEINQRISLGEPAAELIERLKTLRCGS